MREDQVAAIGAQVAPASTLLVVHLELDMLTEAYKELSLNELFPREGDTKESLLGRISKSPLLDAMRVRKNGSSKQRALLNETFYPQPRIVVGDCEGCARGRGR